MLKIKKIIHTSIITTTMNLDAHTCPVCLCPYNEVTHRAWTSPCSHSFCEECLGSLNNQPCPICREVLMRYKCVRTRALEAAVEELKAKSNAAFTRGPETESEGGYYSGPKPAEIEKEKGNEAYAKHNYEEAIMHFTEAVKKDFVNHVLYSNRSAAYLQLGKAQEALADAEKCISLAPHWARGYSRKAAALLAMGDVLLARVAVKKGLELEPTNQALLAMMAEDNKTKGRGAAATSNYPQQQQYQQNQNRYSSSSSFSSSSSSSNRPEDFFGRLFSGFDNNNNSNNNNNNNNNRNRNSTNNNNNNSNNNNSNNSNNKGKQNSDCVTQ